MKTLAEMGVNFMAIGAQEDFALHIGMRSASLWKGFLRSIPLIAGDICLLGCAFFLARYLDGFWSGLNGLPLGPAGGHLGMPVTFVGLAAAFLAVSRALSPRGGNSLGGELLRKLGAVSLASMCVGFIGLLIAHGWYDPALGLLMWTASGILLLVGGLITQKDLLTRAGRNAAANQMVLESNSTNGQNSADAGHPGLLFNGTHQANGASANRYVGNGYAGNGQHSNGHTGQRNGDVLINGKLEELPRLLRANGRGEVVVAVPADKYNQVQSVVDSGVPEGVRVRMALCPPVNGARADGRQTFENPVPAPWNTRLFSWRYESVKRAFDLLVTFIVIVAAAPLMAAIAVWIKLDSPGPVIYRQTRVGRDGQLFDMYKFRSMRQDADELLKDLLDTNEASGLMFKMREDPRITGVGKLIRRTSLDELPQLFNVLIGNMSLVGPRPPLPREVAEYQEWQFQRLQGVPGITGLWQVEREGVSSFEQMLSFDQQYLETWSLALDASILLKTIPAAINGRGAF